MTTAELILDYFAGGGGASEGIERALGRPVDIAINHNPAAIEMHAANHPHTRHMTEDVFRADVRKAVGKRPVGLAWFSPDCKHFSRAKGGKPVSKAIRGLAWVAIKCAAELSPRVIILENVREFEQWGPLVPQWVCPCGWKGTEGQARLMRSGKRACPQCDAKVKPTDAEIPCPDRKGLTFRQFVGRLKALGYVIQWHVLDAADYGAPTHRRRLFLIARNDGEPIVWPDPTHADPRKAGTADLFGGPLKPWRTAAECIDWSVPCPSIFGRKKPLAEKTLRRIAHGIKRYVLDNPQPFLVDMTRENRPQSAGDPLGTVTTQGNRWNLVSPVIAPLTHAGERRAHPTSEPLPTVTGANRGELALIAPVIGHLAHGEGRGGNRSSAATEPLGVVQAQGGNFALIAPTLVQTGYGEREGQSPRSLDLNQPLGTVVAGGAKHALVSAFIAKHFGGMVGVPADTPLPTTTARGTQNQLAVANLVHLNHGAKQWSAVEEPARAVTAGGNHAALVYSFLVKYFGTAIGTELDSPLPTATAKDRFGLATVAIGGQPYDVIVDIGMRMLRPRELARAQGFRESYILTGSNTSQVERIGNSVCPDVACAIVGANCVGVECAHEPNSLR